MLFLSCIIGHLCRCRSKILYCKPHFLPSDADCHQKVLKLFQERPSAAVLDLSHLSLQPACLPPLFTSLQGHSSLTSLSLSGNRLKTDVLTLLANALAYHPNLRALDLSCTGITAWVYFTGYVYIFLIDTQKNTNLYYWRSCISVYPI